MIEKIALVTGATRGLGRGIARALGSKGMTVYLSGRDETALAAAAQEVTDAGGKGIGVPCDHRDDGQVKALFDRISNEAGRLDLLVNNAAAVHAQELAAPGPFWEKGLKLVDMIDVGLRSNYVASFYAAPLMIRTGASLMVNISFYGAASYFHGPAYGAAKAGTDKMVHDMAIDFADTDVSVISLWPGYILSDMIKALPEEHKSPELKAMLPEFETPEFSGLVIAALLADPERKSYSGKALIGARLGKQYGLCDLDGKQPRDWSERHGAPLEFFTAPTIPLEHKS
ncbi:SDR family NAD(P)-dependent oxidoreductase [Parasphingorhabdus sp.]|uniref:SDR family NAD(P)-dependent oxidoreductase n=1 Tax=Parasphingorhabdus sp. TaxID=2709688 RepID=UPI003A8F9673